ncbi:MAG TPA: hypothetical protein VN181_16615, partial [Thermoanaerobaculia bacterium]|nr:hypothetical protein [Thermoanaerobaculia bacterium]
PMRNSKTLVATATLALLLAAAPMSAAPFTRDTDPVGRFIHFVKRMFGVTTNNEITVPIPVQKP